MTPPEVNNTPVCTFGGIVLGGSALFDWEFRAGTAPVERVFTVSKDRVGSAPAERYRTRTREEGSAAPEGLAALLGKASTLVIQGPRATLTVEHVYLLEIQPGDDPNTAKIRLADRRWLWPKRWVATSFNVRQTNGERFLAGEGRIENKLIQPEIQYARYSLKDEATPWKATEAVKFVIEQTGTPMRFASTFTEVELQDVIVDDSGAAAVERVLPYLPGADVFIDEKGVAVVFDRFDGGEGGVFATLPPRQRDGPWVDVVDRRATRPGKVVVLFTIEAEVRLDHLEPSGATATRTEDEPSLYQVGQVPDAELTLAGESSPLARSSWADLSKMFAAWGPFGALNREVTFDELRNHAFKYNFGLFVQIWGNNPDLPFDPVNLARAATSARSWRHLFQIDRFWRQRLQSIRPYRVAIVNAETGAYAPAAVYSDYTQRPTVKGLALPDDQNTAQGWAVRGYADRLADGVIAPARVDLVDEGAGIISVTPQVSPYGFNDTVALGYPLQGEMPTQALGDVKRLGKEVWARWTTVVLEEGWRMSVVLTVVPGSPNDIRRFYAVEIPSLSISPDPGVSEGPTVYARVFPGVMTARFAWSDDQGETIKAALKAVGASDGAPAGVDAAVIAGEAFDAAEAAVTIWPSDLLTNADQVRDVALATAARIYDTLRDRPLGGGKVDMRPELMPVGTIGAVRHGMDGGETTTALDFPAVKQPPDIWRYLNPSTRKAILRVLHDRQGPVT